MELHVGNFPLFSLNHFNCSGVIAADISLEIECAGLFFGFWTLLMAKSHFFLYSCDRRSLGLMGLGP